MTRCRAATPLDATRARLMSRFGMRRGRTTGQMRLHAGIDVGAPAGSFIYAPRPGIVTLIGRDADGRGGGLYGYGNAVVLYHPDEQVYSFYAHLDEALVREGDNVEVGQALGVIGATTNGKFPGMGRHLHMEVREPKEDGSSPFPGAYGRYNIDPADWLTAHGLGFSREGMTADPEVQACLSPLPQRRQLEYLWRNPYVPSGSPRSGPELLDRGVSGGLAGRWGVSGLGAQIWSISSPPRGLGAVRESGERHIYEPPIPDPDFYRELSPIWQAMPLAMLFGISMIGVGLTIEGPGR